MRVRVTVLFILAILMFFVGIGGFAVIYAKGQDLLPKTKVYQPKKDVKVEKYTELTPEKLNDLFEPKEILQAAVTPTMVTAANINKITNKIMVQTLFPGDILTTNYVGDSVFTPREGEKEYPIPANWWEVLDWTGRNGDIGEIWLFPSDKLKQNLAAKVNANVSSTVTKNESGSGLNGTVTGSVDVNVEVKDTPERPLKKPVFDHVRLRYITDSANKAVENPKGSDDRSAGTAKPAEAKIYLKPEQYAVLKMAVQEGYKLIYAVSEE
jgi:hypothetical protein